LQESTTDWGGVLDWATRRAGVSLAGAVVAGGWGRVAASSDVRGLAAGGCSTLAVTGSELEVVRRATTTPVITAVTAATATPIAVIFQRFSRRFGHGSRLPLATMSTDRASDFAMAG